MTTIATKTVRKASRAVQAGLHGMRPLSAVALLLSLAWGQAHALSLGRLTVQSALGEPLRAEIAIPDISPDEAASLKATLASPEAFKAAGVEYNAGLANVRVVFEQRGDGRAALVLTTNRPLTEPFLDLILEANWANGKVSRDYTLLLDPPVLKAAAPASQPVTVNEAAVPAALSTPPAPPTTARAPAPQPVQPRPERVATPKVVAPAPAPVTAPSIGSDTPQQVVVKPGDTAGKIAAATKPSGISLDQMLLALLGTNPQAFIERNVNRLRAGAVLTMPTAEQASATPPQQATQAIVAQSRDFNAFRAKLAANVPAVPVAQRTRQSAGKLEARVEDKQASTATPDKLQLSKGSVTAGGKATPEETLAKSRESQAAAARAAEVAKNLDDLAKLTGKAAPAGTTAAPTAGSASAAAAPGLPVVAGGATLPAASEAASTPPAPPVAPAAVASAPAASAVEKPAPAASAPVKAPVPAPAESEDFLGSYGFLLGLGALLALLGGLALFRARQRRNESRPSAFMDSLVRADPMYGSSGGQRIDTREKDSGASSMGFSPSQLDAAADVDPVVEAEVYLAYGRDVQAEEILKEAMRTYPTRVSIHVKLAEIYAKRRDTKSFGAAASQVAALTQSTGPDWVHVQSLSQQLDPSTVLLQPEATATPVAPSAAPTPPAQTPAPIPAAAPASAPMATTGELPPLDMDLEFSPAADLKPAAPSVAQSIEPSTTPATLDMLDFKLDQLDLVSSQDNPAANTGVSEERLQVKLELASEFMAIGDDEGARALVQEVLAEATGDLKTRAQKLLTSLR